MIFLLLLVIQLGNALYYPFENITQHSECNNIDRDILLSCFEHFDSDNNNELSASELQNILNLANLVYPEMTGQSLLELCDMDYNGILNIIDWNKPRACCRDEFKKMWTCNTCIKAGWTFPTIKK